MVRCILDTLAHGLHAKVAHHRAPIRSRWSLSSTSSAAAPRNALLNQADRGRHRQTGRCRSVEATAVGNLIVQARAHGFIDGDLETLRALVRAEGDE